MLEIGHASPSGIRGIFHKVSNLCYHKLLALPQVKHCGTNALQKIL